MKWPILQSKTTDDFKSSDEDGSNEKERTAETLAHDYLDLLSMAWKLHDTDTQAMESKMRLYLLQVTNTIFIQFHTSTVQRINFQLIFTPTRIRLKIPINFHAAAVQRSNFRLNFTLTQIGVTI
jgi:hypothetical protein